MKLLDDWARKKTDMLTFVQLKEGISLGIEGYQVPKGGLYVPILTSELANRIQSVPEDMVLTIPSIIRGILYVIAADSEFVHRKAYEHFVDKLKNETREIAMETAEGFEKEGDFEEAAMFMRGYCTLYDDDVQCQTMLSAFYVRLAGSGKMTDSKLENAFMIEALRILESDKMQNEQDVLMLFYLGTVYQWQKSYIKAEKTWQRALDQVQKSGIKKLITNKLKEVFPYARYEEGYQLVIQGSPKNGLDLLTPLLKEMPGWWNLHFFIAVAYQQLSEWEQAIHHYGKVLEIRGYHQQTAIELSEIYLAKNDHEKAVHWMEEVLLQKPGDPELLCRMALMKAYTGNMTEAFEYVTAAEDAGGEPALLASIKERLNAL